FMIGCGDCKIVLNISTAYSIKGRKLTGSESASPCIACFASSVTAFIACSARPITLSVPLMTEQTVSLTAPSDFSRVDFASPNA
ncbi:hypothetical protein PMAYCL1PPCAC_17201, partial [Pristionchus mayeri]